MVYVDNIYLGVIISPIEKLISKKTIESENDHHEV